MENNADQKAQEVFALLGVTNFLELSRAYSREDQILMKNGTWNIQNPLQITNLVKSLLEEMDPDELSEDDREWRREILWHWYHHAISHAMRNVKDRTFAKILAQAFATHALELQGENHPNKITRLLYHLVHDEIERAEAWWTLHPSTDEVEHKSGLDLIEDAKASRLF